MAGGYRVGAGRPRGSKNGVRKSVAPKTDMSGTAWLKFVVNDPNADVTRRDRAAAVLANIENRRENKPGKKEQAAIDAHNAGRDPKSPWYRLLNFEQRAIPVRADWGRDLEYPPSRVPGERIDRNPAPDDE